MLLLNSYKLKNFYLNKCFDVYLSYKQSLLFVKGFYGIISYKMPSYYFFNRGSSKISIIFLNKFFFHSFIKHFFTIYKKLYFLYSVRLKIRGLGYRLRKISENLYYFFFNYTNMYYFHIPNNILFKWYKKKAVIISSDFFLLKMLFSHILILKKIGPYRLRGLRYPRQIIFIKKGGKKI